MRVFHFGCRTSKLAPIFETPSPTTMLQGVHADPPSLYLWAIWSAHRASADLIASARVRGFAHEDWAGQDAAATAFRDLPHRPPIRG
jgi:hypothetical protein